MVSIGGEEKTDENLENEERERLFCQKWIRGGSQLTRKKRRKGKKEKEGNTEGGKKTDSFHRYSLLSFSHLCIFACFL